MSERILSGHPAPLICERCEYWSAWEGSCFREDGDSLPEDCPHFEDELEETEDDEEEEE
jgi:hypothetical protein